MTRGKVYLVGAGPGDAGLITVKGLDCLRKAEVIVYDRLIDNGLLDSIRPDAEMVYVGTQRPSISSITLALVSFNIRPLLAYNSSFKPINLSLSTQDIRR